MKNPKSYNLTKSINQESPSCKQNNYHDYESPFLHKPCQKDLRVSYLQQYELKGNKVEFDHQMDKSRTKDALKDITDKYGFVWDQNGKLKKRQDLKSLEKKINRKSTKKQLTLDYTKPSYGNQNSYQLKKLEHLNTSEDTAYSWMRRQTQQTQSHSVMQQCDIDNKINNIWKKYQAGPSSSMPSSSSIPSSSIPSSSSIPLSVNTQNISFRQQRTRIIDKSSIQNNITKKQDRFKNEKQVQNIKLSPYKYTDRNDSSKYDRKSRIFESTNSDRKSQQKYHTQLIATKIDNKDNKYDNKIDQITQKIKKCQVQKQKLQISYKKFDIDNISRSKSKSKSPFKKKQTPTTYTPTTNIQNKRSLSPMLQSQLKKVYTPNKIQTKNQSQKLQTKTTDYHNISKQFSFEGDPSKQDNIITKQQNCENIFERIQELPQQNNNIQQQEQRLNVNYSEDTKTAKKIQINHNIRSIKVIQRFLKQIQLDQQFRNSRAWFYNNQDPHKWGNLADLLNNKYDQKMNYHQLVQRFQSLSQERNPFFSIRDCQQNYQSLIKSFMNSDQHWKTNIMNKFNEECLEEAGFTLKQLDVENKGKLRVEDFVRYLNMKTDSFFRNRDFILIFSRMGGKGKDDIQFSKVLRILTP